MGVMALFLVVGNAGFISSTVGAQALNHMDLNNRDPKSQTMTSHYTND